jgi:arsenical pump membrane protein
MAVAAVLLLAAGVATMLVRPRGVAVWVGPTVAAAVGVATTVVPLHAVHDAFDAMWRPLLFLVFAVPLAVALDRLGVFAALAALATDGRRLVLGLWVLAAAVTVVFNLDAAVVLLTPLYIRIARRHGYPAEAFAFQPALMACLASSVLPVSNLTNLVAAERFDLGAGDFVRHLGPPTVLACAVAWFAYRRSFDLTPVHAAVHDTVDARALRRGLPVVTFVLAGFTLGDAVGVPAWAVAAVALGVCLLLVGEAPWRAVPPARSVPLDAVAVAFGLAVLVVAAVPHLGVRSLLDAGGARGRVRALGLGVVGSDLTNNLPTVLAGLGAVRDRDQVWPLLVGTNLGPVLVVTGSLSGLLWQQTAARLDVLVSARRYSRVGVLVGLPALVTAAVWVVAFG